MPDLIDRIIARMREEGINCLSVPKDSMSLSQLLRFHEIIEEEVIKEGELVI